MIGAPVSALPGTDRATVQPNDPSARFAGFSLRFWVVLVLTGIGTGGAAGVLMVILRAVQHACYSYHVGTFLEGVVQAPLYRRVVFVFAAGVLATAGLLVLRNTPGGSGGKLDERIWFHSGRLPVLKTLAQSVLSITIVGMGASLGRENAPKQAGGAIASWLGRVAGLSLAESRLLVACGVGAGMAAVYNVPFGGALYSLEVLLGTLSLPLIPPALATSFIATAVGWTLLPDSPTYVVQSYPVAFPQLIWAIWFGPVAGVAAVLWIRLLVFADALRPHRQRYAALARVAVFAALGLVSLKFPQLLGNGKDIAQLGFVGSMTLPLLLAIVFLKPLATAACLGSGAPGGLFTPSISFGAALGGFLGGAWARLWPGALSGSYAMIGATAVLAASMQGPVSSIVLMIELTHHINTLMVPILLAVAGAAVVARRIDPRSIYSGRVDAGRQAAQAPNAAVPLRYARLVRPAPVISLAASYPEVLARLVGGGAHSFAYVVDENARLVGRIDAASAACPPPLTAVLSTAAAADLMRPVATLDPALGEAAVMARLAAEPTGELPVMDPASGRLLGIAVRP